MTATRYDERVAQRHHWTVAISEIHEREISSVSQQILDPGETTRNTDERLNFIFPLDTTGFSHVELHLQPNQLTHAIRRDTTDFSRVELSPPT